MRSRASGMRYAPWLLAEGILDYRSPASSPVSANHARGRVTDGKPPVWRKNQGPSRSTDPRHQHSQHLSSSDRGTLSHSQTIADTLGHYKADDAFTNARHRHGTAPIVCIYSAADERAIADPPWQHRIDTAGRGTCCHCPGSIQGDSADGPVSSCC